MSSRFHESIGQVYRRPEPSNVQLVDYFPGIKLLDEIPWPAIVQGNQAIDLSTKSANAIVAQSAAVPQGFMGIVKDLNINFSVAGTAALMIVRFRGSNQQGYVAAQITRDFSTSASGVGNLVLSEGESIAVLVQTEGDGTLHSVDFSGTLRLVRRL